MYENMKAGKTKIRFFTYYNREKEKEGMDMKRKLIIDGNAVYEIDEECRLNKRMDRNEETEEKTEHADEKKRKIDR